MGTDVSYSVLRNCTNSSVEMGALIVHGVHDSLIFVGPFCSHFRVLVLHIIKPVHLDNLSTFSLGKAEFYSLCMHPHV